MKVWERCLIPLQILRVNSWILCDKQPFFIATSRRIPARRELPWKRRSLPKQTKCWKALSLESQCRPVETRSKETRQANNESYRKSFIAKSSQNDAKKKEQEGKEPVFLKLTNTPIVTFGRTQTFLPPPLFRLFQNKSFAKINSLS